MNSKTDKKTYDCYANAEPDEPMFVLLARDIHAPFLVTAWADIREAAGESKEKVAEARACAKAMQEWASAKRTKAAMTIPEVYDLLANGKIAEALLGAEDETPETPETPEPLAATLDSSAGPTSSPTASTVPPPSKSPTVPVARSVTFSHDLTLGVPSDIDLRYPVEFILKPERATTNAPGLGFAALSALWLGTTMGHLKKDAQNFAPQNQDLYAFCTAGLGLALEAPFLTPNERLRLVGSYSGVVPEGRYPGESFRLTFTLEGPEMTEAEYRTRMRRGS